MTISEQASEDLTKLHDDIIEYLKTIDIPIFYGSYISATKTQVLEWDEEKPDWITFLNIAKKSGATYVLLDSMEGEGFHKNKVGFLKLIWLKDGIIHSYSRKTGWWSSTQSSHGS